MILGYPVRDDHFTAGAFAPAGPDLFRTHTCLGCGRRLPSWAAFKAHRRGCVGLLWNVPQMPPPVSAADLDRLADLYTQLEREEGVAA